MGKANSIVTMKRSVDLPADGQEQAVPSPGLSRDWLEGFLYCHSRMNANTNKILEVGSFAYALIELLMEKELIRLEELDARKLEVFGRLKQKFTERGMGVAVLNDDRDKYTCGAGKAVDCFSRLHVCKALCCRFGVALSRQDVEEGRLRWNPGQPYMIATDDNGYCCHIDRETLTCTVRDFRPIACREYDCRHDKRVWADYDNMILSPESAALLAGRKRRDSIHNSRE
jgi:Fe-S-cluster containining protein